MEIRVAGEASHPIEPPEFGEFYAAQFQRIAVQLHAYLGDAEEAQDLTQEAFCRAWDHWPRIHTYDDPAAWVRRVAWNLATSSLRRRTTALRYLSRHREEPVPGPLPDRVALARALAALPARQRRAVVLHHVAQLSTAEIAEQEGVAEGTVRSWLTRGRTALAAQLADDETDFRPAPLRAVQDVVRRRRRARIAALTAAILAALAVPVLAVGLTRSPPSSPSEPELTVPSIPSPTATTSPPPTFETRRIVVPGYPATASWLPVFIDADNAWAWDMDSFALAATADGGRSWRPVDIPIPDRKIISVNLYVTDRDTVTLVVRDGSTLQIDSFLLTTDGGASFSTYPADAPPVQAQLAANRTGAGAGGHYALLCPGRTVFPDLSGHPECDKTQLIRVGSGPVSPQPPVGGSPYYASELREGGDGRLWIFSNDLSLPALQVSTDGARSWQPVAMPQTGVIRDLLISPDGMDVWLVMATEEVYLLRDGAWQRQHPDLRRLGRATFTPIGGGMLLIPGPGGLNVYQDAAMRPLPGSPPGILSAWLLPDGTLVASNAERTFLGVGEGLERTWIEILRSGES